VLIWYLFLQWLGSTILPVWCWCQHRSLGLNQSLWTCIYQIHSNSTLRISFLLQASWTSVVSSCIIILFASRPPDPKLPFYYYTSDHDRYYERECPSFNKPSSQPSQLETLRPAHHEQTCTFVSGWVSLVVKDSQFAFVLHFHLHQHYSNITTVRNLLKLWFFFLWKLNATA